MTKKVTHSVPIVSTVKNAIALSPLPLLGNVNDTTTDHLQFDTGHSDASANVILTSAGGLSFRIRDYCLKVVSPVFKETFALPTRGGPTELPEPSDALRVVLDEITNVDNEELPVFDTMVTAFNLAKRFEMYGPMARIKEDLHKCRDGPRMLALAWQQTPIDRPLVRTAFSWFADDMAMDGDIFRSWFSNHKRWQASPEPDNLTTDGVLESSTKAGAVAYLKAMDRCELKESPLGWKCYDWGRVPVAFSDHLDYLGR
ncbi:hypothetical protein QFC22_001156 [Naganishia vaughanmartiniae]|uniref:Uncharacterized protein n=1 Tax=Naganishia vaughanmartiniae TaxID=1424756 RepID=A0ACC2XL33_9TREE|nr:hypothetical protein QFC22_001156 [Naganishia vaughanmartiniae]